MPRRVGDLSLTSTLNPKVSVSAHHTTPRALSTGRSSLLRSRVFTSLARSHSGIVSRTPRLLLIHFVNLNPPLESRHRRSLACCEASSTEGKDLRQSSRNSSSLCSLPLLGSVYCCLLLSCTERNRNTQGMSLLRTSAQPFRILQVHFPGRRQATRGSEERYNPHQLLSLGKTWPRYLPGARSSPVDISLGLKKGYLLNLGLSATDH